MSGIVMQSPASWTVVTKKKKISVSFEWILKKWVEWRIYCSPEFQSISSHSRLAHQYLEKTLYSLIREHIEDLASKWQLSYDADLILILRKLMPNVDSDPIEISHDQFSKLLRKKMQCHINCLSKRKLPKEVANIIASYLPMKFPPIETWETYSEKKGYHFVEKPITLNFYPGRGNFINDIWMHVQIAENNEAMNDELYNQLLEEHDSILVRRKKK
jgi:hypothetical protein